MGVQPGKVPAARRRWALKTDACQARGLGGSHNSQPWLSFSCEGPRADTKRLTIDHEELHGQRGIQSSDSIFFVSTANSSSLGYWASMRLSCQCL